MPFFIPWTDAEPRRRRPGGRAVDVAAQSQLVARQLDAHLCAAFVDGKPVGVQSLGGRTHSAPSAPSRRDRGSGLAHQGQGLGREMREAGPAPGLRRLWVRRRR